jgi:hypothetical protein
LQFAAQVGFPEHDAAYVTLNAQESVRAEYDVGPPLLVPVKVAVTLVLALMVRGQVVADPAHAPPQVEKLCPEPGVSVKVTTVPEL